MSEGLLVEIEQRLGRKLTPEERHLLELAKDTMDQDGQQEHRAYRDRRQRFQLENAH